jgi:hypothetical protein
VNLIVNAGLIILGVVCLIGAVYFILQGFTSRRHVPTKAYGVQQQEARQGMLVNFFRGGLLLIVAIIILGIVGFGILRPTQMIEVPATPNPPTSAPMVATATSAPTTTPTISTPAVSPTSPINSPTPIPSETLAPTDTPTVPSALVNSPNGLWLREAPGGTQEVELIPDGTVLTLIEGLETVEDQGWQQVQTPAGNQGWVAVEFIEYQ